MTISDKNNDSNYVTVQGRAVRAACVTLWRAIDKQSAASHIARWSDFARPLLRLNGRAASAKARADLALCLGIGHSTVNVHM